VSARLELVEAAAYESLTHASSLPTLRVAGASCIANPALPQERMLNRANGLGLDGPVGEAELDEVDAFFRGHGVAYAVAVSPHADESLARLLRARGFADGYAWMKFRRDVSEPPAAPTGLRVEHVQDGEDFGAVVARAYGMPAAVGERLAALPGEHGWHCFVAYDEAEPAGAAALYVDGDAGWLGVAGTAPDHRRKGAQGALMAARIRRARELGLRELTTETGERVAGRPDDSYRNILRSGFEEAYLRPNLYAPE
jgi:GNAT superfamily N-acetyltransferase